MSAIRGTVRDGKVVIDGPLPADWPEGAELRMELVSADDEHVGIREEDWPTTPEGIAEHLARMDEMQPFLTPDEEAAWLADMKEQMK